MKQLKSQQGMILFFALLMITIFSVIAVTIITMSVSNAKQTNHIERDMQSVDVAEMGIIHYRNELVVKMNEVLKADIEKAVKAIEVDNEIEVKKQSPIFTEINTDNIILKMKAQGSLDNSMKFSLGYALNQLHDVQGSQNFKYEFVEFPFDNTKPNFPKVIEINVKSIGYAEQDRSEVDAVFTFNIEEIIDKHVKFGSLPSVSNTQSSIIEKPVLELMGIGSSLAKVDCTKLKLNKGCDLEKSNSVISMDLNGLEAALKGNVMTNKGDLVLRNSKLFVGEGNFSTGTIKEVSYTKIHSKGNIDFDNTNGSGGYWDNEFSSNQNITFKETQIFDGNKVYAYGNITFGHFNNGSPNNGKYPGIYNSSIYAETGNITIGMMNKKIYNSNIFAGGNLTMGNLNNDSDIEKSTIIVKGNLYIGVINKMVKTNSTIYVYGNIVATEGPNGKIVDSSSLICAGGTIDKKITDKAVAEKTIANIRQGAKPEECGIISTPTTNQSTPSVIESFSPTLNDSINNASYKYN